MKDWRNLIRKPELRYAEDLRSVLRDPNCPCKGPIYSMYRDLSSSPGDREWMASFRIRFDITCIPAGTLCGEHVKTKGHYHPENYAGVGYPEIYQVFEGKAHFLLQKRDLAEILLVDAEAGETMVVPPGFGHVTINPGSDELVMANIVSDEFASEYRFYEDHHGAACYELSTGRLEKNPHYPPMPPPQQIRAPHFLPGCPFHGPLYDLVRKRDLRLGFLNHPERFGEFFTRQR
jgi:glucose-6-phosphate isomerase